MRSKPIIITTAHTGARYSPWERELSGSKKQVHSTLFAQNLPITVEEAIEDGWRAYEEGARLIHLHARNPETAAQYADIDWYREVANGLRKKCPGVMISFPTSRKGEVGKQIDIDLERLPRFINRKKEVERRAAIEFQIRAVALEARPDTLTTFTVPEMKILGDSAIADKQGMEDVPGWTDPAVMQAYYKKVNQRANDLGIGQEIEITTMGEFDVLDRLAERKDEFGLKGPLHIVLLLGFSNGLPIDRQTYEKALERIDRLRAATGYRVTVSCGAVIRPGEAAEQEATALPASKHDYKEVMQWVAEDNRVDAFRVGLEDTPKLYNSQRTNADLVRHARTFFTSQHIAIEIDPNKVRRIFHTPMYRSEGSNLSEAEREHLQEEKTKSIRANTQDTVLAAVKAFAQSAPSREEVKSLFGAVAKELGIDWPARITREDILHEVSLVEGYTPEPWKREEFFKDLVADLRKVLNLGFTNHARNERGRGHGSTF